MPLFGKGKNETGGEESKEERKITRNLKDLKPENKKKRKEPPKPWGKNERIIVLTVLIVTTLVSVILLVKSRGGFGNTGVKINFPKINLNSINFFKGETIIIEKK